MSSTSTVPLAVKMASNLNKSFDLHPDQVPNIEMGYIFEELVHWSNAASNEEAGDHFAGKTFDYMLADPPFGVEWNPEESFIRQEHEKQGFGGKKSNDF